MAVVVQRVIDTEAHVILARAAWGAGYFSARLVRGAPRAAWRLLGRVQMSVVIGMLAFAAGPTIIGYSASGADAAPAPEEEAWFGRAMGEVERRQAKRIYTYCGRICLAVNPFEPMPQLYTMEVMRTYHRAARLDENPPHLFALAGAAFGAMMRSAADQSILVSGESGAGKTESAKLIMDYLATVSAAAGSPTARSQAPIDADTAAAASAAEEARKLAGGVTVEDWMNGREQTRRLLMEHAQKSVAYAEAAQRRTELLREAEVTFSQNRSVRHGSLAELPDDADPEGFPNPPGVSEKTARRLHQEAMRAVGGDDKWWKETARLNREQRVLDQQEEARRRKLLEQEVQATPGVTYKNNRDRAGVGAARTSVQSLHFGETEVY